MEDICLLSCDRDRLCKMRENVVDCKTNLKRITGDVDESDYLANLDALRNDYEGEIEKMKAHAWDIMYSKKEPALIDSTVQPANSLSQTAILQGIRDKQSDLNNVMQKRKQFEALCHVIHELILQIADFLARDDHSLSGTTYAIIPGICNIPRCTPILSSGKNNPIFHLDCTLSDVEEFLNGLAEDKALHLTKAKARHFDEIYHKKLR